MGVEARYTSADTVADGGILQKVEARVWAAERGFQK